MHDLLQEADHLAFELVVGLKVLWGRREGGCGYCSSCPGVVPARPEEEPEGSTPAHGRLPVSLPSSLAAWPGVSGASRPRGRRHWARSRTIP